MNDFTAALEQSREHVGREARPSAFPGQEEALLPQFYLTPQLKL